MKGYKAMNPDMTCRGFQFEIGKTYEEPVADICRCGFHFCQDIFDTFSYYDKFESRIFEIDASGIINQLGNKLCCTNITIVREVPRPRINRIIYSNGYSYGNGYSYSYGNGYSYSYGYGYGYGYGDGYGYGNGYGYGYGDGYGNGNGDGYGDGNGNGDGYGENINTIINKLEELV